MHGADQKRDLAVHDTHPSMTMQATSRALGVFGLILAAAGCPAAPDEMSVEDAAGSSGSSGGSTGTESSGAGTSVQETGSSSSGGSTTTESGAAEQDPASEADVSEGESTLAEDGGTASSTTETETGGSPPTMPCRGEPHTELPAGAPTLEPGVWTDLTPPEIPQGDPEYLIAQGVEIDPCNYGVIYWTSTPFYEGPEGPGGIYKSVDAGATWQRLGNPLTDGDYEDGEADFLDMPLHMRIDPEDPQHMYAGDGVRGGSMGFWVSHNGGETWWKSEGWREAAAHPQTGFIDDVYDIAVDPTDFDHVLVSSHSPWSTPTDAAGVLESKDGGETWTVHLPEPSWGAGHSIAFLYEPTLGLGDAQTWLLGSQGDGYWRTTDAGETWDRVSASAIVHGGGETYYSHTGVLYASSEDGVLRSVDNGASFEIAGSGLGNTGIIGDGRRLYTAPAYAFGDQPFVTSPEDDGLTWTPGSQTIPDAGPFEMAFDRANGIIYAAMWFQGVWALKVED